MAMTWNEMKTTITQFFIVETFKARERKTWMAIEISHQVDQRKKVTNNATKKKE